MKRIMYLLFFIIPFIAGCEKENSLDLHYLQVREVAWNSLSSQERATVITDWKKATVTGTSYQEKSAYSVTFNTRDDALLGPIIVYVDAKTFVVIGQGLRA